MADTDFPQAQRITYLISRYINGHIDFAELQELESWRKEKHSNEALFKKIADSENQKQAIQKMQSYDTPGSLERLKAIIAAKSSRRSISTLHWAKLLVAAVVLICIGGFLFLYKYHTVQNQVVNLHPRPEYIAPGSDKAILTLSGGRKIVINPHTTGLIAAQAGVQISNAAGKIIYTSQNPTPNNMIQYNTIETPKAGKYQLQLPDGTKVWLNAASSLRYPTTFKGDNRTVALTGEAYFEVAKDKTKPFHVLAEGQTVTVLGTHFNINAYHDEGHIATTLVEGSVQVSYKDKHALLKPGEQSSVKGDDITVSKADIHLAIAWKYGQLAFLRTDLKAVLRQISRWYDIDVEYVGQTPNFTISGDVSRDADLSAMLEILKLYDVHFIQQGRKLIITP